MSVQRWMLRETRLLALGGLALASASAVLWWRAPPREGAGEVGSGSVVRTQQAPGGNPELEDAGAPARLTQDLLRHVDHASAASGVRITSATVRSAKAGQPAPGLRTDLQISAAGPYGAVKSLIERLLLADSSLALDRVSLNRTGDSTGELDVQLNFHATDLPRR